MFYARTKELEQIDSILKGKNNTILVYGKRRVGKTTLIKEAIKKYDYIYYECLEDSLSANIESFYNKLKSKNINIPNYINFKDFIDVFEFLNSLNTKYVIVIDEYPYLKTVNDGKAIDSMFQNVIDNHLDNLNLIISGSQVKIMCELLQEGNPLFGRFKSSFLINELNYLDSSLFYSNKSFYDKIAFYSIFGGSPYINEAINPNKTLKENIINTFLNQTSSIYNYADYLLISDLAGKVQAKKIISALGNSKKKYKELEDIVDEEKTGKINIGLKALLELGIVKKNYPINKRDDNKKSYYEISDNALRFFYTYVNKNRSILAEIGEDVFYNQYIKPSLTTYISHRFVDIARQYFSISSKKGKIKVLDIGTYYYDDSKNHTKGEFDCVIKVDDGYEIYEVKYLKDLLDKNTIEKEIKQIKEIKEFVVKNIGFITVFGVESDCKEYKIIDGNDLYNI